MHLRAAVRCLTLALAVALTAAQASTPGAGVGPGGQSLHDRQRPIQPFVSTQRPSKDQGGGATSTQVPSMVETSTWDPCDCGKGNKCVCVMYYLCNPATNTVYTYGEDVLDERFGGDKVQICPGTLQRCCGVPPELFAVTPGTAGNASTAGGDAGGVEVRPPLPVPTTPPTPVTGYPVTSSQVPPLPTDDGSEAGGSVIPPRGNVSSPPTSSLSRWECGVRRTDFALLDTWARVDDRDGEEVAFGEFPWMLVLLRDADESWLGGASLVSPRVALTAAHTVHGMSASELRVRAGEWDAAATDEPLAHQERRVAAVVPHPAFVRRALFHDAALLQLESAFDPAPHVAPVCLPAPGVSFDGRRCLATGWGADAPGKVGSLRRLLRRVDLPIRDRALCEERLRTTRLGIFFHLHESFLCAGAENGKDTCKGDGGGPLVCQSKEDPRRYEQAGIVSWGIGCADPEVPAVYTDVSKLRLWLDGQLQELDPVP